MTAHRVIGVDPGETTAWGLVEGDRCALALGELLYDHEAAHLTRLIAEWHPVAVIVEVVRRVHPVMRKGRSGISTTQAMALYAAGRRAERVIMAAHYKGVQVIEASAEEWRAAVVGKAQADNATIDRVLRTRLRNFPAPRKSNNHERDALGIATYGALRARSSPTG